MEEVGGLRHVNCCDVTAEYGQCNRWSPGVGAGPTWTPHHINNLVAVFILGPAIFNLGTSQCFIATNINILLYSLIIFT